MIDTARESRPWGSFTVVDEGPNHKVKRIVVAAGKRLSYQRHAHRSEHWFVVQGHGIVTRNGLETRLDPGVAVDIPEGTAHRAHNTGTDDLVFVEVQRGDYLGEDDIVRLEDDFGRMSA